MEEKVTDYNALTEQELWQEKAKIQAELDRRAALAEIPGRIREDARTYLDGGGDPTVLAEAINPTAE